MPFRHPHRLTSSPGAPSADRGVVADLARIDPSLYVVYLAHWAWFEQGPQQGRPLIPKAGPFAGRPVPWPRWHVFLDSGAGAQHHICVWENSERAAKHKEDPGAGYLDLDKRLPRRIRADAGRRMNAEEIARLEKEARDNAQAAKEKKVAGLRTDEAAANKGFYRDAMANEAMEIATRDKKIVSYEGQTDRSSHLDVIIPSDEEAGYERVDWDAEGLGKGGRDA